MQYTIEQHGGRSCMAIPVVLLLELSGIEWKRKGWSLLQSKLGLVCPTCGKGYRSNKGGWYVKHVEACGGGIVKAAVVQPEEVVGELKCPKCGKQYRSNA